MEGTYSGVAGGKSGRPVRLTGAGGLGGAFAPGEGSRSWRGGGGWSSHPISADEVDRLRRHFPTILELPETQLKAARSEWEQVTVVARSLGRRVPVDWLAKDISARLKLGYEAEVFILAEDHVALRFKAAEDRDRALTGGPWVVAGQLMAMEAWKPGFIPGPGPGSISSAVVWVRLPKLPMELWGKDLLLRIAAVAGRPLEAEELTGQRKRMGYARVKVVVDTSKPLVPGVLIRGEEETFWQAFVYESLPEFCFGCGRIGHGHDHCPFGRLAQPGEAGVRGAGERPSSSSPVEGLVGGKGSQEMAACRLAFGPWLATTRVRPPVVEKTKMPVEKLKSAPVLPVPGAGRPDAGKMKMADSPASSSPLPDGGWMKPTKVARRRSPVKVVTPGDAGGAGDSGRPSTFAPLAELGDSGAMGASLGLHAAGQKRPRSPLGGQKGGSKGRVAGVSARGPRGRSRASLRVGGDEGMLTSGTPTGAGPSGPSGPTTVRSTAGLSGGSSGSLTMPEEATGILVDGIFRAGGRVRVSNAPDPSQSANIQVLEVGDSSMATSPQAQGVADLGADRVLVEGCRVELSGAEERVGAAPMAGEVSHPEAVARAKAALSVLCPVEGAALPIETIGEGVPLHYEAHSMEVVEEPLPGVVQGTLSSKVQQ